MRAPRPPVPLLEHLSEFLPIWRVYNVFYLLLFIFLNTLFISFKYYFIIYSLFFFYHIYSSYIHSQQLYFSMKNVISTIFFVILSHESHQNFMYKVITSSNLNPPLKLFFYSSILVNNNLLLKIYCENIVVAFLNCLFLFFILFFQT